jgi:hypothetical protein
MSSKKLFESALCSVEGCARAVEPGGYCRIHLYDPGHSVRVEEVKKETSQDPVSSNATYKCSAEGCQHTVREGSKGYCTEHFNEYIASMSAAAIGDPYIQAAALLLSTPGLDNAFRDYLRAFIKRQEKNVDEALFILKGLKTDYQKTFDHVMVKLQESGR